MPFLSGIAPPEKNPGSVPVKVYVEVVATESEMLKIVQREW